jgi:hypothetical protein
MTWTTVDLSSTTYSGVADAENGYVEFGYVENDYILGSLVWSEVSDASTPWS